MTDVPNDDQPEDDEVDTEDTEDTEPEADPEE